MHFGNIERIIATIEPALSKSKNPILIALDGRSGTGKSTLAKALANKVNATIVESDDFYSGGQDADWASRTTEQKVDQCIDWRRIRTEVLTPLLESKAASYHPFDFKTGRGLASHTITLQPSPVIILDGAYSARPELADLINIKILVELSDDTRRKRLLEREGSSFMENWHRIWDAAEDYYFTKICPPSSFDFVVKI